MAQDGWFFFECEDEHGWQALCRIAGESIVSGDRRFSTPEKRLEHDDELRRVLEEVFARGTVGEWLQKLGAAGIPCTSVNGSRMLFDDPHVLANNLVAEHESADVGPLKQSGILVKLSDTPGKLWRAAPGLGQHNEDILAELGYSPVQIRQLREDKVII